MTRYRLPLAALLFTAACASGPGAAAPAGADVPAQPVPRQAEVPGAGATAASPAPERPRPYPIFESRGFAAAVDAGTRTRTGAPGSRYWQQRARYRLAADYEPKSGLLGGEATIVYHNRSPGSLPSVYLHLYDNVFAPDAMRNRTVPVTGGVTLARVAAGGTEVPAFGRRAPRGYRVNGTVMAVPLPAPLASGDSVTLELRWSLTVPPNGAPRGGRDSSVAFVSYWYPQVAVYDDVNGWQIDQYMSNAEFYMGYGDYDVSITVPAGYLIGATGTLQNPEQVLRPAVRERLAQAAAGDTVIHVVPAAERGRATLPGTGGKVTWRFAARQVRDFAWGTSAEYLWDATGAAAGDADGDRRPDRSAIHSFHVAGAPSAWAENARYGKFSIEYLSRFLWPYPYPQMTSIQGTPSCGGMEYPMITCIGGTQWDSTGMFGVTVHEIGHMWFPMQVGSDEKRYSWMDEGLTQFNEGNAEQEFFSEKESSTLAGARQAYFAVVRSGQEVEMMRHGDLYPNRGVFGVATYMKTAAVLDALRGVLGEETFMRAFREYGRRWQWKHPTPYDLFNTFSDVAGRDLSWFWRSWAYETWTLDQAVGTVTPGAGGTDIVIEDKGLVPMPVPVTVTYEGGRTEVLTAPVERWLAGARSATLRATGGVVTRVQIDAAGIYPDTDRTNNLWPRGGS
jgi:hypothetical protein